MKSIIRYFTVAAGWGLMAWVIFENYEDAAGLLLQVGMLLIWACLPYYLYFFLSRKESNLIKLLFPSILLNIFYGFSVMDYFASASSTSALIFIVLPVIGIILILLAYLVMYLITKIFKTNKAKEA